MAKLKVTRLGDGLHSSEVIVAVWTADGPREEVMLDRRSVSKDLTIDVGHPIARREDRSLVELPRETARGSWRVWVPNDALIGQEELAA